MGHRKQYLPLAFLGEEHPRKHLDIPPPEALAQFTPDPWPDLDGEPFLRRHFPDQIDVEPRGIPLGIHVLVGREIPVRTDDDDRRSRLESTDHQQREHQPAECGVLDTIHG